MHINIRDNLLETLSRLSLRMQEAMPLEQGLTSILEEAHSLLTIDRFNILVADAEEKVLRSVASWGNLDEPLDQIFVPIDARGGGLFKAYREGIEIVWSGEGPVPDEFRLAHPFSQIKAFRSRHFAILPLTCRGKAIGVLGADNKFSRRPIGPEDMAILRVFAAHAAVAIQNARLYEETVRGRERAENLRAMSEKLSSSLSICEVLQLTVEYARNLANSKFSSIYLKQGGEFRTAAVAGEDEGYTTNICFTMDPESPLGQGPCGRAARAKRSLLTCIPSDPSFAPWREAAARLGLFQELAVPLIVQGEVVGILANYSTTSAAFDQEVIALLGLFANHAAIAIQNARLFQETSARAERLRVLTELSRTVTATLDLQQVFDFVVQASVELLNVAASRLWVLDETGKHLYLRAAGGELGAPKEASTHFHVGEGVVGRVVESREILYIRDMQTDPRFKNKEWVIREGLISNLTVPLLHGDRALGCLALMTRDQRTFTGDEVSLVAAFATQAAIALQNARLYQELQVHSEHLEQVVQQRTEELRRRNLELEEANRHKSAFLATVSHELRTPLNAIIGFSELLVDRLFGDLNERQERYVHNVLQSGRHLLNLINDILDLSKVEWGRMELRLEQVPLAHALDEAMNLIQSQAIKKGIAVEAWPWQDLPTITADPLRLRQILNNLLSNAVKFTPEGGRVVVTARAIPAARYRPAEAEIVVQDSGIGIREEDLERIFLPFVQVDDSLARRHEGTGLGLALTRRLITLHGGRIWAESQGEGKGARFVIRLPLQHAPQPTSN